MFSARTQVPTAPQSRRNSFQSFPGACPCSTQAPESPGCGAAACRAEPLSDVSQGRSPHRSPPPRKQHADPKPCHETPRMRSAPRPARRPAARRRARGISRPWPPPPARAGAPCPGSPPAAAARPARRASGARDPVRSLPAAPRQTSLRRSEGQPSGSPRTGGCAAGDPTVWLATYSQCAAGGPRPDIRVTLIQVFSMGAGTAGEGGRTRLTRGGRLLRKQLYVVLVREGLGLHQEVARVLLECGEVAQLKHARHARLRRAGRGPRSQGVPGIHGGSSLADRG